MCINILLHPMYREYWSRILCHSWMSSFLRPPPSSCQNPSRSLKFLSTKKCSLEWMECFQLLLKMFHCPILSKFELRHARLVLLVQAKNDSFCEHCKCFKVEYYLLFLLCSQLPSDFFSKSMTKFYVQFGQISFL